MVIEMNKCNNTNTSSHHLMRLIGLILHYYLLHNTTTVLAVNIWTSVICGGCLWLLMSMLLLIMIILYPSKSLSGKVISISHILSVGIKYDVQTGWRLINRQLDRLKGGSHFKSPAGLCWSSVSVASCSDALFYHTFVFLFILPMLCSCWMPGEPRFVPMFATRVVCTT